MPLNLLDPNLSLSTLWGSYANNLPGSALDNSYVPVSSGTVAPATTSAGSWWGSFTSGLSDLANAASPIVGAVTGRRTSGAHPTPTGSVIPGGSNTVLWIVLGGGVIALVVWIATRRR